MSELNELLARLVEIDSVNPDLVAGGAGEDDIARFVAAWLSNVGIEVRLQEVAPGRPNVIARIRGTGGGRTLMLNAHLDTVALGGPDGGLRARIAGDRLYGRGSFDMKGSLAAMMLVAAELAADPPPGDVIITAVVDEEYASIGTQAIVGEERADGAIVTEPTGLEICIAHKGFIWAEIETRGIAAHGSLPKVGVDAIAKMGHVLVGLEALDRRLHTERIHPLVESASVHASTIGGGIEWSTYPDRCRLRIERRTIPGETTRQVIAEVQSILDDAAAADPAFQAELEIGVVREPFEIMESAPLVTTVKQAVAGAGATPRILSESTGWMDSALLAAAGIPTVIFGPDGDGAHAATEWVSLSSVEQCRHIYLSIAREFCR